MGPIDYQSMLTQLDVSPLLQLQQVQAQKREAGENRALRQQTVDIARSKAAADQAQEAAYRSGVDAYLKNPTSAALTDLTVRFPDQYQALRQAAEQQSAAVKKRNLDFAMRVGGLTAAGQTDKAISITEARIEALRTAGESTEISDDLLAALKSGDLARAKGAAGLVIASSADADQTKPILEALRWDAGSERAARDDARADAAAVETQRHNRVTEGQGAARVDLSRQASARAAAKGKGRGKKGAYTNAQLDALIS